MLVFFRSNTNQSNRDQILTRVGVTTCNSYERYLGLPTLIGKSKYSYFKNIKEDVAKDEELEK